MTVPDRLSAALGGRYRIERELGAGGMATVYLAHDERHDRNVALKVLKPELAAVIGAERFLVEIKTTANLQHPNILPLHDSGEVNGTVWYVMPLVEGESLRDRLQHETQLPIDDAIEIAREVASALDYAHRHGVIHRDIKPENILLHDGRAVVADFGIALAMSRTTGSTRLTETGMSLGTPHYMSPEQALGEKTVDARTDVYALGAVLYEMLVGEPPFTGPSAQAIIAKVMNSPAAPISPVRPTVPAAIEAAVMRALAKLPADRFKSAAEFSSALQAGTGGAVSSPAVTGAQIAAARRTNSPVWFVPWVITAGALVALASFAMRGRGANDARVTAAVIPLEIRNPSDVPPNEVGSPIAISPDGSLLVYVGPDPEVRGTTALWRRPLDGLQVTPIAGTRGAQRPRFSDDGKSVYFLIRGADRNNNINKVVPVEGGLAQDAPFRTEGLQPLGDGSAAYVDSARRSRRVKPGEVPVGISLRATARLPIDISPDGQMMALSTPSALSDSIRIGPFEGERVALGPGNTPRFVDDRTLAFRSVDGTLMAGGLDATRMKFASAPIAMAPGVATAPSGSAAFAVGRDGTLIYIPGGNASASRLTWVRPDGSEVAIGGAESRVHGGVALAPDAKRAVVTVGSLAGAGDVWLEDLTIGGHTPITSDGRSLRASWSRDGRSIAFLRQELTATGAGLGGGRVYERPAAGDAPAVPVPTGSRSGSVINEFQWSPDRRSIAIRLSSGRGGGRDLMVQLPGDTILKPFAADSGVQERGPRFSPDGKWLSYVSDKSGRDEVYVGAFPSGGERVQISIEGGREAVWSADGSRIFYRAIDGWMMAATITRGAGGTSLQVTKRERLFDASPYLANQFLAMYDVAPDGRFLMLKLDAQAPRTDVVIIRSWAQQVKARLKSGGQ